MKAAAFARIDLRCADLCLFCPGCVPLAHRGHGSLEPLHLNLGHRAGDLLDVVFLWEFFFRERVSIRETIRSEHPMMGGRGSK